MLEDFVHLQARIRSLQRMLSLLEKNFDRLKRIDSPKQPFRCFDIEEKTILKGNLR